MRKLLVAAAAGAALSIGGVAGAADLGRPVMKAPPPPPVYSWTGCYVAGGVGYGLFDQRTQDFFIPTGLLLTDNVDFAGRGWLGTAQVGCDYQFAGPWGNWLIGAFGDVDWTNIRGQHSNEFFGLVGEQKLRWEWAVGGRIGWLVTPQLLTYFSAGYTQARFNEINYTFNFFPIIGLASGLQLPERTYTGYFVGGGTEYGVGWWPGLFWKTEYRFSDYRSRDTALVCVSVALCGVPGTTTFAERIHPYVQTVRTELVWRFNWAGGVRPY